MVKSNTTGAEVRVHLTKSGSTLIEVVVVVLILGIIAAVAVPALITNSRDAEITALMQRINAIEEAAELYKVTNGSWPATLASPDNAPGDFQDVLPDRTFTVVPGGATSASPWIQWAHTDTPTVEFAAIIAHKVDPGIAAALDERFDDGDNTQGNLTYQLVTVPTGAVANVQHDVVFRMK